MGKNSKGRRAPYKVCGGLCVCADDYRYPPVYKKSANNIDKIIKKVLK